MIRLRAVYINTDWKDFWAFRRQSERNRIYGISADDSHTAYAMELAKVAA